MDKKAAAKRIMHDIMDGTYKKKDCRMDQPYYKFQPIPDSELFRRLKVDGYLQATKIS